VAGLLLVGCTAGEAPESDSSTEPEGASPPSLTVTAARELPFDGYADAIGTLYAEQAAAAIDRTTFEARESYLARCMKAEGFEYTPEEYEPPDDAIAPFWTASVLVVPALPEDRSEVARVGYGTDDVDAQEAGRLAESALGPNVTYLESLGPAAQEAYMEALSGAHGMGDADARPEESCSARAEASAPHDAVDVLTGFSSLLGAMADVVQRGLYDDPRTVAVNDEWYRCMAEAGHDVRPPEGRRSPAPGPSDAYQAAVMTAPDGRRDWAQVEMAGDEIPVDQKYLVGSEAERAIALADHDCRASTRYVDRLLEVLVSLEEDFVQQHAAELARLEAAAAL